MDVDPAFQPFGLAHLVVIALTMALPFVLAAFVRKTRWPRCERIVGRLLAMLLLINYLGYEIYLALTSGLSWEKALPFQLCDWAMIAIIVALLTGREALARGRLFLGNRRNGAGNCDARFKICVSGYSLSKFFCWA